MNIPLVNLARQYESIKKDADNAVLSVLARSDFILGKEVEHFEKLFASYLGVRYAVGVASGTDAIKLMAMATGITAGDEVIVQSNTFISTVLPFIELGAKPVFVDCDPETGQMDVSGIARAITKKTRAILPVHLYGYPAPMKEITAFASRNSLLILEDAAQAHGSSIHGKKCGSFGDMAAFSFYPGKNLGAFGDAGAVVTASKKYADRLRMIRNIGQRKKYDHAILGVNSRLDTIQAAVLSIKLKHLNEWNEKRQKIASTYIEQLLDIRDIQLPTELFQTRGKGAKFLQDVSGLRIQKNFAPTLARIQSNWHLFTIRTAKRDALMKHLEAAGIHCGIHYPVPLHITPALKFLGYKKGDFPHAEKRAKTLLTLPLYAELTEKEIAYIIKTVRSFYSS